MDGQISCFLIEPTDRVRRSLRRYSNLENRSDCPGPSPWHSAIAPLDVIQVVHQGDATSGDLWSHDDPHWPLRCAYCGYEFQADDEFQLFVRRLYRAADGREIILDEAPAGAMYFADWLVEAGDVGPDGKALCVVVPAPDLKRGVSVWHVDGPAGNCTLPGDKEHRCWCRSGEAPKVTVSKHGCKTCSAGGGSIQTSGWHGHLVDGVLVPC